MKLTCHGLLMATLVAACTPQPQVSALEHVEHAAWSGARLEVTSARGIGSLALEPAPRGPLQICFRYDAARQFGRIEGLELIARMPDGKREEVAARVDGACASVDVLPRAASLQLRFVDYYR